MSKIRRLDALTKKGWFRKHGKAYLSWDLNDVRSFLVDAGNRQSSKSGGDSDAEPCDPVWDYRDRRNGEYPVEVKEADLNRSRVRNCLALVMEVASRMTHKDVCVMFGRDLFPVQGVLAAWQHKLRGTWVYMEGVSRTLTSACAPTIAALVVEAAKRGGIVYGVDTGFRGRVPDGTLWTLKSYSTGLQVRVVLMSADNQERRAFKRDTGCCGDIREQVLRLEHHPKPFMRAVETTECSLDGTGGYRAQLPVLRLSCQEDILKAAKLWQACFVLAKRLVGDLPTILNGYEESPSEDFFVVNEKIDEAKGQGATLGCSLTPSQKHKLYNNVLWHKIQQINKQALGV